MSSESGTPQLTVVDGTRLGPAGEAAAPFVAAPLRHPAAGGLVLAPLPPRSADLPTVVPVDAGLAAGAARGVLPRSRTGGSLYVLDGETAAEVERLLGASGLRRAIRELRRRLEPALLAAPGAGDRGPAAIALEPLPAASAGSAEVPANGGRPLLLDVASPDVDAETLIAALRAGAAGALIRTGDVDRDRELLDALGAALKGD